jgi:hypothetical protein
MGSSRLALACLLAACLTLAGCSAGYQGPPATDATPNPDDATPNPDRLGWEAGYAATDPIAVTAEDGLNETEREVVVARTMARVEEIRGLEFEEPVSVEVISRERYRERSLSFSGGRLGPATDTLYEALFLVGEDRETSAVFDGLFETGVVGYYSPDENAIVVVSDSETPTIDRATLAHELVHALQDQHLDVAGEATTRDERLARLGLTEGDAVAVTRAYERRCGTEWECIDRPRSGAPPGGAVARDPGVYLSIVQPYVSGPAFVEVLVERGGWAAVDDAYDAPPDSTEQVIHPERYPEDTPTVVEVPDRSSAEWEVLGNETAGEAAIHVMFWTRGQVPRQDDAIRTNYSHPRSAGWAGDRLVAYTNGSAEGYVWTTVWENESEAAAFERAYRLVLLINVGAERLGPNRYVVREGPYTDAFRVTREGDTVTVVNAPTVETLSEVHAS